MKKRCNSGLTLIEIIIALAIIGIITTSFSTIFVSGYKHIFSIGRKSKSHFVAQDGLENLIALKNSGNSESLSLTFIGPGLPAPGHSKTVNGATIKDPSNLLTTFLPSNHGIVVDVTPPVITLVGSPTINLYVGQTYTEPGATATDDIDGNITYNIMIGGNIVNTSVAGSYIITYNVSDISGNAAEEKYRTVNVLPIPYYGNVEGKVTENVHPFKNISGVTVRVKNGPTIIAHTTTASNGTYTINHILVGTYTLEFVAPGYVTNTLDNQVIADSLTLSANIQLQKTNP